MGKTSLALGMAQHAALHAGTVVGIFSLEMSKPQLVLRMLSSEARVDSHSLRTGRLQKEDWWRLAEAAGKLEQAPIFIDDSGAVTVQQMRGKSQTAEGRTGPGFADRGLSPTDAGQKRFRVATAGNFGHLPLPKSLAKEPMFPSSPLSQLSRAVEAESRQCRCWPTCASPARSSRTPTW